MPQKDAPKQLLPVIVKLKRWRDENGLSQSEAFRALNEAGIEVALDSLQTGKRGPWSHRGHVVLPLADYLRENPKIRNEAVRRRGPPAKDK